MADSKYAAGAGIRTVCSTANDTNEWKANRTEPVAVHLQVEPGAGRFAMATGLEADAGAGAPPAAPGSLRAGLGRPTTRSSQPSLPPTQTSAGGMRHIVTWLASTPSMAGHSGLGRRAKLQHEYQELLCEHQAERACADELQAKLSSEMRELRDQCQEQGQTVGLLTHRLADARDAVTAELQAATTVRAALAGELMSEESQRRALQAACRNEEAELEVRVHTSEKQLAMMSKIRACLEAHLQSSVQIQTELREHIAAERVGCSELEIAGERELVALSAHSTRVQSELNSRLQAEREEVESWRTVASAEIRQYKEESERHSHEETMLLSKLTSVREVQDEVRANLRAESTSWMYEIEHLRERLHEADQECWQRLDAARRYGTATGACECERAALEEELELSMEAARTRRAEVEGIEEHSAGLLDELHQIRESMEWCHEDDEAAQLCKERDSLLNHLRQEAELRGVFESELEALRKSRGILCWRRRQPLPPSGSAAPLPPPSGPPPSALRPQNSHDSAARPQAKGGGRGGSGGGGFSNADPVGASSSGTLGGMRDEV
mmetsp:Transcript_83371/g.193754  ORF Transcript_83371/g.193754 Transcript_83371/m.193754 type:complete len:555 (-) Transcript_83371:62-1726(-)